MSFKSFKEWIYDRGGMYGNALPATSAYDRRPHSDVEDETGDVSTKPSWLGRKLGFKDPAANQQVGMSTQKNPDGTITVVFKMADGRVVRKIVKTPQDVASVTPN